MNLNNVHRFFGLLQPLLVLLLLFSRSVMSDSLQLHGLPHARLPLSFTISWSLLKLMSTESVMQSNHLIFCCPLLLLPSTFPSIKVFSSESSSLLLLLLLSHFSRVRLCATPQTADHQAPPSLGFSRQEYWSGLPFPSPMHESEK